MSPMNHVGRRLLPPIFIPNSGHNQSASRTIALTFLTKMGSWFKWDTYTELSSVITSERVLRVPGVPTALTVPTGPRVPTALKVSR